MSNTIKGYNKKVTSKLCDQTPKCNCIKKSECPMEWNCQFNNVVFRCEKKRPMRKKVHLGLSEGEWKSRFYNHQLSFKYQGYSNKTMLSSYMWHFKSASRETPKLQWSFLRYAQPYSNISKKCLVCLYEKLEIFCYQNQKELLNKRHELICKCHHANKFLLKNYTGNNLR